MSGITRRPTQAIDTQKGYSAGSHVIGQRFGNYIATGLLGEGGMGAVYLAEHPAIGRRVAIKVLRPEFKRSEELLGRFLNEARAANAIRHPNIIEILDSGTVETGAPYLVLELLEGEPVSARLRRLGKLAIPEALEFVYQTASALGAAHTKRIVHRDLKPDNLFIVPDPSDSTRERIKVLDFGIAKLSQQDGGESVKTRTGTLMGTPVYMSPEQCLGNKEIDLRSDIYSLGIILYEMLCGRPPFVSTGFGELVTMHLGMEPTPPRSLNNEILPALQGLVMKCLEKQPDDRFASMSELQNALKTLAGDTLWLPSPSPSIAPRGTPVGAPASTNQAAAHNLMPTRVLPQDYAPTFPPVTAKDETRRQRKRLGGVALLSLALIAAIVIGGITYTVTRGSATRPELPARQVSLTLTSQPAGAEVFERNSQTRLGRTPLHMNRAVAAKPLALTFRSPGFEAADRDVPLTSDFRDDVVLRPVAAPVVPTLPAAASPPEQVSTPRRRKAKRPIAPAVDEPGKL